MKAAVLKSPENLQMENVPKPVANEEFLVVEVKACGICGSDLRYYYGENPWALHTLGENVENPPNIILGHEFAGIVHEVKNKEFQHLLGKRVAVLAFKSCGVCDNCRRGLFHLCENTAHLGHGAGWGEMEYYPGGMAEYCQVWNTNVCEIPDDLSFEEAVLLDPISVGIHAVHLSEINPGDDVLVFGTGAVGLSIAQAVKAFGAGRVICTDINPAALSLAKEVGVDTTVVIGQEELPAAMEKTGISRVARVFDTVGTKETQKMGLRILKEGGTMVNLVANEESACYRLMDLAGERKLICSANNLPNDYLEGIKLIQNGVIKAKKMLTHQFPLEELQKGFEMMMEKEKNKTMKVVLIP